MKYFHAFIDGVDFVFIDAPLFRHRQGDIYGGNRQVKFHNSLLLHWLSKIKPKCFQLKYIFPILLQEIMKRMILFCKVAVEVLP